ncbi:MAG: hypothetical protein KIH69_023820 [Anaerolineae bacterium]|nr:hypothetical protein [Anaerolineae bacterium]
MNTHNRIYVHIPIARWVIAVVLALGVFMALQTATQADTGRPSGVVIGIIRPSTGGGAAAPTPTPIRRTPDVAIDQIDHIMPTQPNNTPTTSPNGDPIPVCDTPADGCRNVVSTGTEPIAPATPPPTLNGPAGGGVPPAPAAPPGVPIRIIRIG